MPIKVNAKVEIPEFEANLSLRTYDVLGIILKRKLNYVECKQVLECLNIHVYSQDEFNNCYYHPTDDEDYENDSYEDYEDDIWEYVNKWISGYITDQKLLYEIYSMDTHINSKGIIRMLLYLNEITAI